MTTFEEDTEGGVRAHLICWRKISTHLRDSVRVGHITKILSIIGPEKDFELIFSKNFFKDTTQFKITKILSIKRS